MKRVVFGGFCLIAGILIFMLMRGFPVSLVYGTNLPDLMVEIIGVGLAIYGFFLGLFALNEKD